MSVEVHDHCNNYCIKPFDFLDVIIFLSVFLVSSLRESTVAEKQVQTGLNTEKAHREKCLKCV